MWGRWLLEQNSDIAEISLLDVKELYDAAYAEKANARVNLKKFKALISAAERLDALYREQLAAPAEYGYRRAA